MVVPSIANPFFTSLVVNVEHVLAQRGLQLFLCDSRSDPDVEAQRLKSLVSRQVDGIIISPCHGELSSEAVRASAATLPVVQLDRFAMDTQTDWVGVDDDAAQSLVMEHLSERGARSAAFISSELTNSSTELRRAASSATRIEWGSKLVTSGHNSASTRSSDGFQHHPDRQNSSRRSGLRRRLDRTRRVADLPLIGHRGDVRSHNIPSPSCATLR
ncbi:hypothetical protein GCM10020255_018210 [Rhodococcus baikonurensis]